MACEVVICEVLCFISNNFDKLTVSQLKPVLINLYNDDEVSAAKDILKKAVKKVVKSDVDLPRLPKRQGPNKANQTVDDLMILYAINDEKKLNDELPLYVAADLVRVPFLNADSMNIANVAQKLEMFEQRLLALEQRTPSPSLFTACGGI